ncbi:MAG: LacI family DNA-binding transcriptional regulator [Bacteroidales bacterium]|nr:LacI family DNA-binding transcriptional regulator [Bacteroidales bacterium]
MEKRVKIKDIAEKCGFSSTLVSLVLNDKASRYGIKPETQEKVLYTASQMGYFGDKPLKKRKNTSTDNNRKASIIAMIVPGFDDHFIFEIAPLLDKAFSSIGLAFTLVSRSKNDNKFKLLLHKIKKLYTGIIIYGDAADDMLIRDLKASSYPFIVLEKEVVSHRINMVSSDSENACRIVAEHIYELGYKRISLLDYKNRIVSPCKTDMLIESLHEKIPGGLFNVNTLNSCNLEDETDVKKIIKDTRPPDATHIFIVKDADMVYPLLSLLKKKNIRVPSDIAVIAMDDRPGFRLTEPPVTALKRDYPALALKTSQMLWTEIKNDGKSKYKRSVRIKPELLKGKSSGAMES